MPGKRARDGGSRPRQGRGFSGGLAPGGRGTRDGCAQLQVRSQMGAVTAAWNSLPESSSPFPSLSVTRR